MKKQIRIKPIELNVEDVLTHKYIKPKTYVYWLIDNDTKKVHYIGKTNNLQSTFQRHFEKIFFEELSLEILGEFYDAKIAEFVEHKIIEKFNSTQPLLNKIIGYKDE